MDNNSVRFCISVPYNDKELIRVRNERLKVFVMGLSSIALILFFAYIFIKSYDDVDAFLSIFLLGGAFLLLLTAVISIVLVKKIKYENKFYRYVFYEKRVEIFKITKKETGEKTKKLYNVPYKKKSFWHIFWPFGILYIILGKFIYRVYEDSTKITMSMYVFRIMPYMLGLGGLNSMIIPKSLLSDEVKEEFIEFLKQKTGSRYKYSFIL